MNDSARHSRPIDSIIGICAPPKTGAENSRPCFWTKEPSFAECLIQQVTEIVKQLLESI